MVHFPWNRSISLRHAKQTCLCFQICHMLRFSGPWINSCGRYFYKICSLFSHISGSGMDYKKSPITNVFLFNDKLQLTNFKQLWQWMRLNAIEYVYLSHMLRALIYRINLLVKLKRSWNLEARRIWNPPLVEDHLHYIALIRPWNSIWFNFEISW